MQVPLGLFGYLLPSCRRGLAASLSSDFLGFWKLILPPFCLSKVCRCFCHLKGPKQMSPAWGSHSLSPPYSRLAQE